MATYKAPTVPVTKYNMTGRVAALEVAVSSNDSAVRELKTRVDNLPKPEPPAAPQKGERGPAGPAGRDAAPAKDGRDAVGIPGPQGATGAPGRDGRDAPQREELDNLLIEQHREWKALRQDFEALQAKVQALIDMNLRASEYIEFLRAQTAARLAVARSQK